MSSLELLEGLFGAGAFAHFENVEFDGFTERATFTDGHDVSDFDVTETGRQVDRHVFVPLFEPEIKIEIRLN